MAAADSRTYSWTSRTRLLRSADRNVTPSPLGQPAGQPQFLAAKRFERVADRGRPFEVEIRRRGLHLSLERLDVGIELCLGPERLALLPWRRRRRVIALVDAREHVVDVADDRLGGDAVLSVVS